MPNKLKVLLLENDSSDAFLIQRELRDVAIVDVALNGQMFTQMLAEEVWDCVLCDLALPDMDGKEAIKLAKARRHSLPVIIVTGSVNAHDADAACAAGAVRFFLKQDALHLSGHEEFPGLSRAVIDAHQRELLEVQALKDNRLEILGHMTAGFTHDLNNLLQVVVGGPGILRRMITERLVQIPADIERILDAMESTGRRGAEMSKQISTFIRGSNGSQMKVVKVEYLLAELQKLLRDSFPKNITVAFHAMPGTASVKCDITQIIQLLLNLCVNARDVLPYGGLLNITAQDADLRDGPLTGHFVMIHVRDNGPGIKPEVLPRVFDPFFTTKEPGKGTGLGLSMARRIAADHHGDIDVRTGNAGTSFFVYLPAAVDETHEEAMARAEEFDGQGKTVLVVDDEASMRMMLDLILTDANYKPLLASSGMEALSYFRSNQNIGLLLSDISMPMMSGPQLAEALRGQSYAVPIVFLTGQMDLASFEPAPQGILKKPFNRSTLLSTIRDVLSSKA